MKTDPTLQEVLADAKKHETLHVGNCYCTGEVSCAAKLETFIVSVVHRTREAMVEEAMKCVPEENKSVYHEKHLHTIRAESWNACRTATLQALEALKERKE